MKVIFDKNKKNSGYMELTNSTEKSNAQLYIYGDICGSKWDKWADEDKCPQDIADLLNSIDANSDVDVYINSGGGSVFGALAIVSQLSRHNGKKTAYVDGLAASAASIIALACDEVVMNSAAQIMIHKPLVYVGYGNADDLRELADMLDKTQESILDVYMTKVKDGVTRDEIVEMVNAETWLKGDEAAEIFDITLNDLGEAVACSSGYFGKYKNTPKVFKTTKDTDKDKSKNETLKNKLQIQLDLLSID